MGNKQIAGWERSFHRSVLETCPKFECQSLEEEPTVYLGLVAFRCLPAAAGCADPGRIRGGNSHSSPCLSFFFNNSCGFEVAYDEGAAPIV